MVEAASELVLPARWRAAAIAVVAGGLVMAALFIPFTLTHGPTSFNEESEILGWDMHVWGLLLGLLPNLLIAAGLWPLRPHLSGPRRGARIAATVISVAFSVDAIVNLAFRALGPPFVLFVLAPTLVRLASLMPGAGRGANRSRFTVGALGLVYVVAIAFALIPLETADGFGGFRVTGAIAYGLGGLLWAVLGLTLYEATPSSR